MNDKQRSIFGNWRVWLAVLGFWTAIMVTMVAFDAFGVVVDGVRQPLASWAVLQVLLQFFGPFPFGTMVILHRTPSLVQHRGNRFWYWTVGLVLVLAIVHAIVAASDLQFSLQAIATRTMVYCFYYAAILGFALVVTERRQTAARERELIATQLRALRAQLQPHFLFNTLHAIGVTAKQDGATAARMTTLLGDLLRQTLRERGGALVSLAEEHDLLQPYLQLQQLRFADRLRVDVDLPADVLTGAVPDLLLQPLVENALQHGIERRPGNGHVRVVGRRVGAHLLIDVHDDGVGLPTLAGETALGTGLGATKARLAALYGDGASLSLRANERGGTTASLVLPWREVAHAA